jgi:hypothetical protein
MSTLMDLVAGERRQILLAIAVDDIAGLSDRDRFDAHLSLGAGLDPTWLDLFSEAVRALTGREEPRDFLDSRSELDGPGTAGDRTVEQVDRSWVTAIAMLRDHEIDAIAGRWIDLVEEELGDLPREEKPWIRTLAADIVRFCRAADRSETVMFAWSL